MKDIKKIDITKKIKLPISPIEERKKDNRWIYYLFIIAILGTSSYYYFTSDDDAQSTVKVKKKALVILKDKAIIKNKLVDYSYIILTQKCLTSSVKEICNALKSTHPLSGIEGAYSIADTLYITLNTHLLDRSLLSLKPNETQKEQELNFVVKNYARKMHPLKFKKQNYVYQKLDQSKDYAMTNLISILFLSKIDKKLLSPFSEVILIEFNLDGPKVMQDFVIKEKSEDFFKKLNRITELDLIMYYYSGIYGPLNDKVSAFKKLQRF